MKPCLGVVREVYSKWERRSPITPEHVKQLVQEHDINVLVQPSRKRVFTDLEFQRAGATITEDLAPAGAILGVKQVQANALLRDKTYLFFSHTIKAQAANMPLLDKLLEKRVRLIDYETIRDVASGERLVAFGEFAGKAGMIDTLRGLGSRLLGLGISNPFLNVAPAYSYPTLADAMAAIRKVGKAYRSGGGAKSFLPAGHGPLTVVFTGAGKVSRGAQSVFEALDPIILPSVDALNEALDPSAIYGLVVRDADVCRDAQGSFSKKNYLANPSEYDAALFARNVLPKATVVFTGAYWDARFPRWIPTSTFGASAKQLLVLCDAACDVNGSVEFVHRTSTVEDPFFFVDAAKPGVPEVKPADESNADVKLVCAVDILPSELPRDASKHFGDCLMPFLPVLAHGGGRVDVLPATLEQAVICANGKLAPSYQYIAAICEERKRAQTKERSRDELRAGAARVLRLRGHLFDSKLMNRTLDLVEALGGRFRIVQAGLAQPRGGPGREHRAHTSVLLQVEAASKHREPRRRGRPRRRSVRGAPGRRLCTRPARRRTQGGRFVFRVRRRRARHAAGCVASRDGQGRQRQDVRGVWRRSGGAASGGAAVAARQSRRGGRARVGDCHAARANPARPQNRLRGGRRRRGSFGGVQRGARRRSRRVVAAAVAAPRGGRRVHSAQGEHGHGQLRERVW